MPLTHASTQAWQACRRTHAHSTQATHHAEFTPLATLFVAAPAWSSLSQSSWAVDCPKPACVKSATAEAAQVVMALAVLQLEYGARPSLSLLIIARVAPEGVLKASPAACWWPQHTRTPKSPIVLASSSGLAAAVSRPIIACARCPSCCGQAAAAHKQATVGACTRARGESRAARATAAQAMHATGWACSPNTERSSEGNIHAAHSITCSCQQAHQNPPNNCVQRSCISKSAQHTPAAWHRKHTLRTSSLSTLGSPTAIIQCVHPAT